MMKKVLILVAIFTVFSCNNKKKNPVSYSNKEKPSVKATTKEHPGKKLLETKCFLCHNVSTPHKERIAPPMIAIKAHYIQENTKKEDFIKEFSSFVKNPIEAKTKLRGAVRKFGVMPNQVFNEEEVKKIAEYLFDYKIEEPTWFKEHWNEKKGRTYFNEGKISLKDNKPKTKAEKGLSYALGTKKVLGKNLMGTIQQKGTVAALQFCNEKAYKLTDSMALKYKVTIKRVSDKVRNPKNVANAKELEVIENYKKVVLNDEKINPIIEDVNNQTKFYYPIVTNSMCLQCHGKPKKQVLPNTLNKIAALYPNDEATEYDVNQVRGIWSITFNN